MFSIYRIQKWYSRGTSSSFSLNLDQRKKIQRHLGSLIWFFLQSDVKFNLGKVIIQFKDVNVRNNEKATQSVWPDWAIYWTLGNFSKPVATISLPKSPTLLGNFCKGVKNSFLGNFYRHLATFYRALWTQSASELVELTLYPFLTCQNHVSFLKSDLKLMSRTNFSVVMLKLSTLIGCCKSHD